MENNSKYEDVVYLVTNLCKNCSNEELAELASLAAQMKQDDVFRQKYLKQLKSKYMNSVMKIQKGEYTRVPFSVLHKEILSSLKETKTKQVFSLISKQGISLE